MQESEGASLLRNQRKARALFDTSSAVVTLQDIVEQGGNDDLADELAKKAIDRACTDQPPKLCLREKLERFYAVKKQLIAKRRAKEAAVEAAMRASPATTQASS